MFDADLSEQHGGKYGGHVVIKAKDTTWGSIYGSSMLVSSKGAFIGMDLGGGGAKPPSFPVQTNSPRGINIFSIPDDIRY